MASKNLEIQSLRGYAILLTVIAHLEPLVLPLSAYTHYFWLGGGVDLFFCISGFVIARGLLAKRESNFIRFYVPFLVRRFFRLWPAALFWSLVVLFLSFAYNQRNSFDTFEHNVLAAVAAWLQVENFRMVSCLYTEYVQCTAASPLRIYWSLSLEEQFYFIFPVLLFFLGNRKIAILAAALAVSQMFLHRPWPSPLWFFRTDAICIGVLIACIHVKGYAESLAPRFLDSTRSRMICSIVLCMLLVLVAKKEVVWFFNGLVALVSGLLVFVASYDKGYFARTGACSKVMAYLGERSYSMYLTHMLSILLVRETFVRFYGVLPKGGETPYILGIAALALTLLLSEASYRFIESPLREKGRRVASKMFKDKAAAVPA
ncbi:acyltransferase family protein [Pseudomonas plecoglossicida]|uniref:Acyltransferase n=1 Tax=Pseudomonas plecoglossicida TaxID=70775 RepID=A0AAD0QW52_PSEDL|nr:acyltransferase [Pseudomonas plecoglossicida]AXM95950.1 acyltransferase [Pseudomonas plecoglossicida]QLB56701.1 acyltransferase [Pseudomonas plecoglossicida]